MAGGLASRGVTCGENGGSFCSPGAFAISGTVGAIAGGVTFGVADVLPASLSGWVAGGIAGAAGGASGYGAGCALGSDCSWTGLAEATAFGGATGAALGALGVTTKTDPADLQARAADLQARAADLQGMRERPWLVRNGTTTAIAARNFFTRQVRIFIATEADTEPTTFAGQLNPDEQFVPGVGHAEQTVLTNLGRFWRPLAGGVSRNVCETVCAPLIEGSGGTLGVLPSSGTPPRAFRRQTSECSGGIGKHGS